MWKLILYSLLFEEGMLFGVIFWIVVALAVLVLFLIGILIADCCHEGYVKINTDEIIEENIMATVAKKDYIPGYTSLINAGKRFVPISHRALYYVHLDYEVGNFILDSKELYDQVKENTKIPVKLVKYLSKDGKVLKTYIEVEEDS